MIEAYSYSYPSFIYILLALISLFVTILVWRKKATPGAKNTTLFFLALFIWSFAYIFESAATHIEGKLLWSQVAYIGTLPTPLLFLAFAQRYCNRVIIRKPIGWSILAIIPVATLVLAWTNNSHHLVWTKISIQENNHLAVYSHGWVFWIYFIYAYLVLILGLGLLIETAFKLHKIYRSQAIVTAISLLIVLAGNILYLSPSNPVPGMEWTLIGFIFCALLLTYGMYRFKLFDLFPLARTQLVETMPEGVCIVDLEGRIKDINPSFFSLLGIPVSKCLGTQYADVFRGSPKIIEMLSAPSPANAQVRAEILCNEKTLDIQRIDLTEANQQMIGRLMLINDISSLKKTESALFQANKLLSTEIDNNQKLINELDAYAHTVAHDLKTPLNSLVGFSELLTDELPEGDLNEAAKYSLQINSSAHKMVRIIEELLVLSSVRSQSVDLEIFDIGKTQQTAENSLANLITESKAVITKPEEWPAVVGYGPWVEEIWVNYISNAIKYGGKPPIISIGFDVEADKTWFWVKDNGRGLTNDQISQLFKPYSRLSPHIAEGQGLGLSIVKRILEQLGGQYKVLGNKDGSSTTFYFSLPGGNAN